MFFASSGLLVAFVEESAEDVNRTAGLGFGLAMVPFVFVALAFLSRHRRAPIAVLKSLGIWVLVVLPIGLMSVVLAITLAFGLGGMFSLRAEPWQRYKTRASVLGFAFAYTLFLLAVIPLVGVFTAIAIPLAALGIADTYSDRKEAAAETET